MIIFQSTCILWWQNTPHQIKSDPKKLLKEISSQHFAFQEKRSSSWEDHLKVKKIYVKPLLRLRRPPWAWGFQVKHLLDPFGLAFNRALAFGLPLYKKSMVGGLRYKTAYRDLRGWSSIQELSRVLAVQPEGWPFLFYWNTFVWNLNTSWYRFKVTPSGHTNWCKSMYKLLWKLFAA